MAVLPYLGGEWLLPAAVEALVCGWPVAVPDLPLGRDIVGGVGGGRLFSPTQEATLAQALDGLLVGTAASVAVPEAGAHQADAVARAVEEVYITAAGRARPSLSTQPGRPSATPATFGSPPPSPRGVVRLLTGRRPHSDDGWINADLHVHSSYSKDCGARWRRSSRPPGRSVWARWPSPITTRSTAPWRLGPRGR